MFHKGEHIIDFLSVLVGLSVSSDGRCDGKIMVMGRTDSRSATFLVESGDALMCEISKL
jgi:hypothetical protein